MIQVYITFHPNIYISRVTDQIHGVIEIPSCDLDHTPQNLICDLDHTPQNLIFVTFCLLMIIYSYKVYFHFFLKFRSYGLDMKWTDKWAEGQNIKYCVPHLFIQYKYPLIY